MPIGLHSFQNAREKGCILVDETDIIYRLMHKKTSFFLSGPGRFGKGFFGNLKSCGDFIKFGFVTGATKFPNNLVDISDKQYATTCGLTQVVACYGKEIDALAQELKISHEECFWILQDMCGGYCFQQDGGMVYNPYSVMKTFFTKKLSSRWQGTGTLGFLEKRLKETDFDVRKFTNGTPYGNMSLLLGFPSKEVEGWFD